MIRDSRLVAVALLCLMSAASAAAPEPPRYASIRGATANLREGPSYDHRILWLYTHKNYPLQIIASFDAWRRVKDVDGVVGWMHHSQLTDRRTVLFIGFTKSALRQSDDPASKVVAYAQPGVVAKLRACKPDVCEVEASGADGWVNKKNIWGVAAGEVF